jgi:hypothetical protein
MTVMGHLTLPAQLDTAARWGKSQSTTIKSNAAWQTVTSATPPARPPKRHARLVTTVGRKPKQQYVHPAGHPGDPVKCYRSHRTSDTTERSLLTQYFRMQSFSSTES